VLFWFLFVTCWVTAALYAMLLQLKPRANHD